MSRVVRNTGTVPGPFSPLLEVRIMSFSLENRILDNGNENDDKDALA